MAVKTILLKKVVADDGLNTMLSLSVDKYSNQVVFSI